MFLRFHAATHISRMNYTEITKDRPRQSACELSALNVDFNTANIDPLGTKCPPYEFIIWYPRSKHANYAAIDQSSTRTVPDRPRLAAYCNQHCWQAFRGTRLWPWTLKYSFLVIFSWSQAAMQTRVEFLPKLLEIDKYTISIGSDFLWLGLS